MVLWYFNFKQGIISSLVFINKREKKKLESQESLESLEALASLPSLLMACFCLWKRYNELNV